MKKKRTYVTNAEISKKIGWPGWAIFGIILAGVFFILGTFYGPDWYDNFHNKEGIVTSPSEIEYLCPHKTMKKSISLTNYEDSPIEDYSLAFSWPIEENVTVEIDYVENFQKKKILGITFGYGNTKNQAFIIPSIKPKEILSMEIIIRSNCQKNFDIEIAESPIIIEEFFAN